MVAMVAVPTQWSPMHQRSTLEHPSHSRLAKLHECRRAYYYRYVRGLHARGEPTRPLAGKALHAGLDVIYRKGYDAIDDAHRAIIATYGDHDGGERFPWMTTEHLMAIMVNYVKRWAAEDDFVPLRLHRDSIERNEAILAFHGAYDEQGFAVLAEAPMVVRITPTLTMTVIIDLVVAKGDQVWVVDHKATCSYLGRGVLNKYLVSHQPPLYIEAVKAIVGRCDGALLNAIYMGEHARSPTSKAQKFDRYTFDYTAGQLGESIVWARRTQALAVDEEACEDDESWWLQNPSAYCAGCDYLQLCEVGPALREGRAREWYDTETEGGHDGEDEVGA